MTVADLVKEIARRHQVPEELVGGFVYEAVEGICHKLNQGEDVKIRGLGTLRWCKVEERKGTGACKGTTIPAGWKLRFQPAKAFRSRRTKCRTVKV